MKAKIIMSTSLRKLTLVALLAGFAWFQSGSQIKAGNLGEGKAFPSLESMQLEGKVPKDLSGKIVLIDFWASWCGPCRKSFPVLEAIHKDYSDKGVVVLGVNLDKQSDLMSEFLSRHPASFPIVRDAKHQLVSLVGIQSMPSSFILDEKGNVRFVHKGFHGTKTAEQYRQQINTLLEEK